MRIARLPLALAGALLTAAAAPSAEAQAVTQSCTPYQLTVSQARRPDSVAFAGKCRAIALHRADSLQRRADSLADVKRFNATRPAGYTGPCWRYTVHPGPQPWGVIPDACVTDAMLSRMSKHGALSVKVGGKWRNYAGDFYTDSAAGSIWRTRTVHLRTEDGAIYTQTYSVP